MDQARSSGPRMTPLTASECRHLWWAAPPLAVLFIAHMLFELVGGGYARVANQLFVTTVARDDIARDAVNAAAGMNWATLALVYLCISAAATVAALRIIADRVKGPARRPFVLFAAGVVCLGGLHLIVIDIAHLPLRAVFAVTYEALSTSPAIGSTQAVAIGSVVSAINVMSVFVPALILTAAAASALPPVAGWNERTLARRALQVRRIVAVAAAFMVAGVLHMGAWTHWAGATLSPAADAALDEVAAPMTLFWGTAFTLMIASFYLPVTVRLSELADGIMDEAGVAIGDRPQWLADRGLSSRLSEQLPQLAAVAAPLLAGPLSNAIGALGETVVR